MHVPENQRTMVRVAISSAVGLVSALALTGCLTSNLQLRRADNEVYGIIQKVQKKMLGDEAQFSIETPSGKIKPDDYTPKEILEERSKKDDLKVGIEEALAVALKQSRAYQTEKETLYLTALALTGERHNFRPQFFGNSTATRSWDPTTSTTDRIEQVTRPLTAAEQATAQAEAQAAAETSGTEPQPIPETITEDITITQTDHFYDERGNVSSRIGVGQMLVGGMNIGFSLANDLLRYYTGDPRKSAVSVLQANILQPILRGAGRTVAAERLTQAERDVIYQVRDFSHFQNEFTVDIVMGYFRLLQQKDTILNEYSNYLSRVNTTKYLSARKDRERPLDVSQAEQAELEAKSRYIDSVVRFRTSLDAFKITLGLPQTTVLRLDDTEMDRLRDSGLAALSLESEQAFQLALEKRLPLLNDIDRFEDSKRRVKVAADGLRAGLDLFADASLRSEGPLNYKDFNFRDLQANVGVELDLPLNKKLERNSYRTSLVGFQSQLRALGLSFDSLRSTIDQALRELQQFQQNFEIQTGAVKLAEKRVQGARLNFQAGNSILRDLEEAQDALINAQNAVTAATVDYLEARLRLLVELGVLDSSLEEFWLQEDASKVDLNDPARKTDALPESFLNGDEVIPPYTLFPE